MQIFHGIKVGGHLHLSLVALEKALMKHLLVYLRDILPLIQNIKDQLSIITNPDSQIANREKFERILNDIESWQLELVMLFLS